MLPRWLLVFGLFVGSLSAASAQDRKDPFRFVPGQAELVLKVERPSDLLAIVEKHEIFQKALLLPGYRELYDSTNVQRLYQLIAYFEKQLDKTKEEILDEVTAGGVVLAVKFSEPKAAMLVVQAKNDPALRRFVDASLLLLEKELERQESKDRIERRKVEGFDTFKIGKDLRFAIVDGSLIVTSDDKTLQAVLDQQIKRTPNLLQIARFNESRKQAPAKALAWGWLNLEELRKIPNFKTGLDSSALDPNATILFGGLVNLLQRSPDLSGALVREGDDFRLRITMPRGHDGMGSLAHMLLPPDGVGTLAPLQPARAIGSSSYFLDLGQFWEKKADILGPKNAASLDEGDKNLAKFLGGIKLAKLMQSAGPHQRLVFAQQKDSPYKLKPQSPFPAFALVVNMRDPSFATDMNGIFRSAALLATFSFGLNLKEEKYQDCELVSYYFSETKKVAGDPQGLRFNFSPTYVSVGDQFVMSATAELARDLIDVLKSKGKLPSSKATMQTQLHASGFNEVIRGNLDAAITQLILSQAVPPKNAKQEMQAIMHWIDQLGILQFETEYGTSNFRYDIVWRARKK